MNSFGLAPSAVAGPKAVAGLLIGAAGLAFCLTLLFLGMRAVMDIGGACADGGPYVSRQSCPDGVPLAMVLGIFGIFLFGGILAVGGARVGGRYGVLLLLAWPALFLSLGWNFLEYGIRPPEGDGGPELGWLLCGVVFVIIGGGPLLGLVPARNAGREPTATRRMLGDLRARREQLVARAQRTSGEGDTSDTSSPADRTDLTSRLERLTALHAAGSLTDVEFDEAKRRVIAEVAAGR